MPWPPPHLHPGPLGLCSTPHQGTTLASGGQGCSLHRGSGPPASPQRGVCPGCSILTAQVCHSLTELSDTRPDWPLARGVLPGLLQAWLLCAQAQLEPCKDQAGPSGLPFSPHSPAATCFPGWRGCLFRCLSLPGERQLPPGAGGREPLRSSCLLLCKMASVWKVLVYAHVHRAYQSGE